jgi:hypothetical protein
MGMPIRKTTGVLLGVGAIVFTDAKTIAVGSAFAPGH